jgi:ribosome-associated protein
MIERALVRPKARRKTRPTRASVSRRLDEKRRNKDKKSGRRREE